MNGTLQLGDNTFLHYLIPTTDHSTAGQVQSIPLGHSSLTSGKGVIATGKKYLINVVD